MHPPLCTNDVWAVIGWGWPQSLFMQPPRPFSFLDFELETQYHNPSRAKKFNKTQKNMHAASCIFLMFLWLQNPSDSRPTTFLLRLSTASLQLPPLFLIIWPSSEAMIYGHNWARPPSSSNRWPLKASLLLA